MNCLLSFGSLSTSFLFFAFFTTFFDLLADFFFVVAVSGRAVVDTEVDVDSGTFAFPLASLSYMEKII